MRSDQNSNFGSELYKYMNLVTFDQLLFLKRKKINWHLEWRSIQLTLKNRNTKPVSVKRFPVLPLIRLNALTPHTRIHTIKVPPKCDHSNKHTLALTLFTLYISLSDTVDQNSQVPKPHSKISKKKFKKKR